MLLSLPVPGSQNDGHTLSPSDFFEKEKRRREQTIFPRIEKSVLNALFLRVGKADENAGAFFKAFSRLRRRTGNAKKGIVPLKEERKTLK